jgi:hypothetical protein
MKHTKELSNENEMNSLPNYANSEAPSERPNPEHIRYLAHRLWVGARVPRRVVGDLALCEGVGGMHGADLRVCR